MKFLDFYNFNYLQPLYLIPLIIFAYCFATLFKISIDLFKNFYVDEMIRCIFTHKLKRKETSFSMFKILFKNASIPIFIDIYIDIALSAILVYFSILSIMGLFSIDYFDSVYQMGTYLIKVLGRIFLLELLIIIPNIFILMFIVSIEAEDQYSKKKDRLIEIINIYKNADSKIINTPSIEGKTIILSNKLLYNLLFKSVKRISLFILSFSYITCLVKLFISLFKFQEIIL